MKILVFAHTPPPHHGQSYMVERMIAGLGGDRRGTGTRSPSSRGEDQSCGTLSAAIECYHVNARLSDGMADIGEIRTGKFFLILRYCLEAIWCRFRYGVTILYYVPAPGKRGAFYRDLIVMGICRPFFQRVILHWHAVGLGDWLHSEARWLERALAYRLLGRPDLGIGLAIPSLRDALWFDSRKVELLPNGIPDPCPNYSESIQPLRKQRLAERKRLLRGAPNGEEPVDYTGSEPPIFRVLYLGHCTLEKGLFDALDAVALANQRLTEMAVAIRVELVIAGIFLQEEEKVAFASRVGEPSLAGVVRYVGFANAEQKDGLLREADCLCFPTFYYAESFGLVVIEAMAAGLAVVGTRWRAVPDLLPVDYPLLFPPKAPAEFAEILLQSMTYDGTKLRECFTANFTEERHSEKLRALLLETCAEWALSENRHLVSL